MKKTAVVLFIGLALFACKVDRESTATDTTVTTTAAVVDPTNTTPDADADGRVEPDTSAGTTVLVVLEDTTVGLPTTDIPPGPASFTVTNSGSEVHDLRVEGAGISVEVDGTLEPGQSKTMQVDLKPGTYEVYCPILDHREKGQTAQLTIPAR